MHDSMIDISQLIHNVRAIAAEVPAVEALFGSVSVSVLQSSVRDQKKLLVENSKLKKDIEQLRTQLQDKQRRRTRTLTSRQNNIHFRKRERI